MKKNSSVRPKRAAVVKFIVILFLSLSVVAGAAFSLRCANDSITRNTYPLKYQTEIQTACEKYGVDQTLIYGVIKTESDFDPNAKSAAGAIGLMQLMPETFTWMQTMYKDENQYSFEDLYDPALNIDYGVETLSVLLKMYGDEETAVCAYNGGLGNVNQWLENSEYSDDGKTLKKVPFAETDNYRRTVERNKSIYQYLYFDHQQDSLTSSQ